jgi:hypothetical protein
MTDTKSPPIGLDPASEAAFAAIEFDMMRLKLEYTLHRGFAHEPTAPFVEHDLSPLGRS